METNRKEIIDNLLDQARDRDYQANGREDSIFADDARYLREAAELLKSQAARVMLIAEVTASAVGTILWVEECQRVTWNLFPLEIETISTHPDTGTDYLFFITYHDIRKFECSEYNQTWRCWTSRPTDAQREATPWEK